MEGGTNPMSDKLSLTCTTNAMDKFGCSSKNLINCLLKMQL